MFEDVEYTAAFIAGLLSFFSPCILPLVPSYFSFITGISMDDLNRTPTAKIRSKVIFSTLAFVLGFSLVFILLGATAAYFSTLLYGAKAYIRIGGGVIIFILGLHLAGIFRIRALEVDKRIHLNRKPVHILGAFFIGMAFGAGWSPCIGPLLSSILILASNQDTVSQGIWLLTIYSAGVAIPFIVLSFAAHLLIGFVRQANKAMRYINIVAGVLLILTGALLITNKLRWLTSWLTFDQAQKKGQDQDQKFLLYFYADWCGYCRKLDKQTFTDPSVAEFINANFIPVRINSDRMPKVAARYGVQGLPDLRFLSADGKNIARWPGYIEADKLLPLLKYIQTDSYLKMGYKEFLAQ